MSTLNCAGCMNAFKAGKGLQCFFCLQWYDLLCCNIPERRFKLMNADSKKTWKCPGCLNKQPKVDNTNTPIRPSKQSSPNRSSGQSSPAEENNITLRSKLPHHQPPEDQTVNGNFCQWYVPLTEITSGSLRDMIRQEINHALHDTIKGLVNDQLNQINDIVSEFKQSLSFFNDKYEEMKSTLEEKATRIQKLEKDNSNLRNSLKDVTKRMNILEQHHIQSNNIELQCIPEHRSENLVNTVLQLSKVLDCNIKDTDIQLCSRVAKKDTQNTRSRSVLVKFNSSRIRDMFLAASVKFNKANSNEKLSSSHLGIAVDKPVPIFVVEHLSPENKLLHAATRVRAKELGYKFVWVRNGRIFLRRDETSQTVVVGDHDKLMSLT